MNEDEKVRLMRRAKRASKAITGGPEILKRLLKADARAAMIEGVELELPPVTMISGILLADLPHVDFKVLPVRQFIGMAVKAIMAEEGYRLRESGVRIPLDLIFKSGATYELAIDEAALVSDDDLLLRIVEVLTPDELTRLSNYANKLI